MIVLKLAGMRRLLLSLAVLIAGTCVIFGLGRLAYADCANPADTREAIECGSSNSSGVPVTADPERAINNTVWDIINILSVVVGIVAVIMIIVGGFRYISSGGDPNRIASAKNTIIYALIGLLIAAFAQVIVRFVLKQSTTAVSSSPSTSQTGGSASSGGGNQSGQCTPGRPGIQC
jgi:hypothetical protein